MSAIKNISLYIPFVFPNFDKEYVAKAFENVGEVSQVDFVAKRNRDGKNGNAVYIHFNKWYNNKDNINLQYNIVENGKDIWYHDESQYYWIVLPNTAKKHIPGERKPTLDLGELKAISCATTPVKEPIANVCPGAPQKRSYADVTLNPDEQLEVETEIYAEMDEIEKFLEEEDMNLITIDGRYVQQLESENQSMNMEIMLLRAALINLEKMYQAESARVREQLQHIDDFAFSECN